MKNEKEIKIIDLLNKIANGEEVPERIKYKNRIFEKYLNHNCYIREDSICDEYLLDMSKFYDNDRDFYNDEVEIISNEEEFEDIEELILKDGKVIGNWENGSEYCYTLSAPQTVIIKKINEVIKNQKKIIEKLNKNNITQ